MQEVPGGRTVKRDRAGGGSAIADERVRPTVAATEAAESQCRDGPDDEDAAGRSESRACDRKLVGADRLAPNLSPVVLARHGFPNICANVHLNEGGGPFRDRVAGVNC